MTSEFTAGQLAIIDERMRSLAETSNRRQGILVSRDTTGPNARAVLQGDTVAVDVLVMGNVYCQESDWVLVTRYGPDWYVTSSFAAPAFGEANQVTNGPGGGTGALVSATYIDLNEFTPFTFVKMFDVTFVRIGLTAGGYSSAANTEVRFGVRLTPDDSSSTYTASDYPMNRIFFNQVNTHVPSYHPEREIDIPAGSYTVSMRWRRSAGAGNVFVDTGDTLGIELDERVRTAEPIL